MDRVYPVVFIDAIVVKVRDGQVTNRPFYGAVSVTTSGKRDILGIWTDDSSEGAKYWNQNAKDPRPVYTTQLRQQPVNDSISSPANGTNDTRQAVTVPVIVRKFANGTASIAAEDIDVVLVQHQSGDETWLYLGYGIMHQIELTTESACRLYKMLGNLLEKAN